ncbi:bifunctional hydroxymethylpyrimidine kinase/phosphomethylpyrimidine kinase [bacterium]|nr:MAG: bifunctional hydroxymethylpyrimidine kinase/phosphomethylpyrimidine kinase [bacterium]
MPETRTTPTVLCIGGLDPSGGAGIAADARACSAFQVLALPVATAIVVQNTRGVKMSQPVPTEIIVAQIETLLEDIQPGAIKIGMLPSLEAVEALTALLAPFKGQIPMVMDTVFAPSTGPSFNDDATIEAIADQLLPLANIVTPNALEAQQLGADFIGDRSSMELAAFDILSRTKAKSVLIKGGHLEDPEFAVDLFFDGTRFTELRAERETGYEVRGTGCLLASAIAAQLAAAKPPVQAVLQAKDWLTEQFRAAQVIGSGRRIAAI